MELNYNTPIETHNGIDVKRDDLMNGNTDLPPWGKIGGVKELLLNCDKKIPVACLSTRGSYSGWCLSGLGKEYGYDIKVSYPNSKVYPQEDLDKIKSYGAELNPIKPNMVQIVHNKHKSICKENGWQMFPYGFDNEIYHDYFQKRIEDVGDDYDNLIVVAGTGVTSIGLIKGFLTDKNKWVHLIVTSTPKTIEKILQKHNVVNENIILHTTDYDFYDEMKDFDTPFPCNKYWDKKAWWWIQNNRLKGKSLFWNLGG